ncbi:hypothetical protein DFH09DRAFT_1407599 [Mycena vulgaris]|nr:hypothetical protein DFH09DRAFT_1407599 [Mycena vulgaris]
MCQGQFSKPHQQYIESFLDKFTSVLDEGLSGRKLTEWKQKTAGEILDSDQLSDLDTTEIPRATWFKMIVRKFTNYRTQVYLKSNPNAGITSPSSHSGPLFKFSSVLTGRQLFAKDNSATINSTAAQRLASMGHNNPAAVYQTVLKELWDSLSDDDKCHWEEMADTGTGDIEKFLQLFPPILLFDFRPRNQAEFSKKMHGALTDLCRGGMLGDSKLVLFYAFRNPTSGDLDLGTIHGHSARNRVNFGGSRSEMQMNYGVLWATFAEAVIPRPVVPDNSIIPRNEFGVPVFPSIDLNVVTPSDTRLLLTEYWSHLWAHAWGFNSARPPIPWADIEADPSKYYDTVKFLLSNLPLVAPQTLNTLQTAMWGEFLVRSSSLFEDSPFVFYPHAQLPDTLKSPIDEVVSTPPAMQNDESETPGTPRSGRTTPDDQVDDATSSSSPPLQTLGYKRSDTRLVPLQDREVVSVSGSKRRSPDDTDVLGQQVKMSRNKRARKTATDEGTEEGRKCNETPATGRKSTRTRRAAQKNPASTKKTTGKSQRHQGRAVGYVYSDEEADAFTAE